MRTFTNFYTNVSLGAILTALLLISCNQTEHKKSDDTLVEDTVPEKKELRRFTLTNTLSFDSVQYLIFGKDTIQLIQWKNGSKDGHCLLGWKITHPNFIYPDHSDTIFATDTMFNTFEEEYWNRGKLISKKTNILNENKRCIYLDSTVIIKNDTLSYTYGWYDSGEKESTSRLVNHVYIDTSFSWYQSGQLQSREIYGKNSCITLGQRYKENGELIEEYYVDCKEEKMVYRIKDGKKVK